MNTDAAPKERHVPDPQPIAPLSLVEGTSMISSAAAPLLAGFALTILLLVLPTTVADQKDAFTRWPEPVLLLLVGAAVLLVNTVQAGAHARANHFTPDEARMWYRGLMGDDALANLRTRSQERAMHWIRITRWLYQGGVVLLLSAIALVLVPPRGEGLSVWRLAAVAVAGLSVLFELFWISRNALTARVGRRETGSRQRRTTP